MKGLIESKLREELRKRGRAYRTEETYVGWYFRFVRFHQLRHPESMGVAEVEAFLTYLAMEREVAASTQGQAFHSLLFLYKEVLGIELKGIQAVKDADFANKTIWDRNGKGGADPWLVVGSMSILNKRTQR